MTLCLCFFQQKTAYEMRISDWSSYVCSSDLTGLLLDLTRRFGRLVPHILTQYHHPDTPEISVIRSNIVGDAKYRVTQKPAGAYWHSDLSRPEERRVGTEWGSQCRAGWSPDHYTKNKQLNQTTETPKDL